MNYLIDLEKWGIKKGLPNKPYVDADYIQADKNIQGINNALQYAYENGYTTVVLPRGDYALCYPREILMREGVDLNLNRSKLKVIFDSNKKSPLDTRTGTDYYNFVGITFVFEKVENATIRNGEIVGCREDRSFFDVKEVAVEHSYGVVFRKGARFNILEHCKVRDYMGDNISFLSTAYTNYVEFDEGNTIESLDYKTGQPIAVTTPKTTITKMLPIQFDAQKQIDSMYIAGSGYTRLTGLVNKFFDIFFYDKDNKFIGVHKRRRIYSNISIPKGANKYRLQFLDETIVRQHSITVWFGHIPSHNVIQKCDITNGHRGGITFGGSHNIIENNVIHGNGKGLAYFLDGKPLFNDPTRYAINMEDSYGSKCVIRNNDIYDSFHGILVGCYDVDIYNNHIHDTDFTAVNLYAMSTAKIRDNYFYNNLNNLSLMDPQLYSPYVLVEGNTFVGGKFNLNQSSPYRVEIRHNHFENMGSIFLPEGFTMSDCHITYTETVSGAWLLINKLKNCTFKAHSTSAQRELIIKTFQVDNCSFENFKVRFEPQNNKVLSEFIIVDSDFVNCEVRNHIFNGCPLNAKIKNSKLTDTVIQVGITNVENQTPYTILEDCTVSVEKKNNLFSSETNRQYTTFKAVNCKVTINNPTFNTVLASGSVNSANELVLENSEFIYTGSTPLNLKAYTNKKHIRNFVDSDNIFININLQ
ncbi:right-handed parallel beta-helix repeat-containing protein [Bacillus sp. C1]